MLAEDDLQVRVGIHVVEIDRRGDDVSGLAVNAAARRSRIVPQRHHLRRAVLEASGADGIVDG